MKLRITGARVLDPSRGVDDRLDVDVENGRIAALGTGLPGRADEVLEVNGLWLTPGFVDLHTHLRDPGEEYKESIETGTRAAAAGGYTTVCCMANTDPPNDSPAVTEYMLRRARQAGRVRVLPIGAATQGLRGEALSEMGLLAEAGVVAFSDDGNPIMSAGVMRRVLEYASGVERVVISHCEDLALRGSGVVHEGSNATCCGLLGSPAEAETVMVARDLELARLTGARLHIAHVSAARSVELIAEAKERGVRVTAEVTPHHLALSDAEIMGYDTNTKMAPPLRTARDREALRAGLASGVLDCLATDHAPHALYEKDVEYTAAPFGVVGLETALPVALELGRSERIAELEVIRRLSTEPARALGLRAGTLEPGAPADFAIVDPERVFKVEVGALHSRSKNSPFLGREFTGRVVRTYLRGELVFDLDGDERP